MKRYGPLDYISAIINYQSMKYRPSNNYPPPKRMILGGVQFGLDYGITNSIGMVSENESIFIIRHAINEGVHYIDTAAAYGDSERVIGKSLAGGWSNKMKVITKLIPFDEKYCQKNKNLSLSLMVKNSFQQSCENLKVDHVDTFMLHRADHLRYTQVLNELTNLQKKGYINHIGVSVQSPQELQFVLQFKDVEVIQMPYNILDYRWDEMIKVIKYERKNRSLIIHARVFCFRTSLLKRFKKVDDCRYREFR